MHIQSIILLVTAVRFTTLGCVINES